MRGSVTLRPAAEADRDFLYRVYASTREKELRQTPWNDTEKQRFLSQQFTAQDLYYREHYRDASYDIVLLDGEPIGRLYVDRRDDEIRVVDITLLPGSRGAGIGGAIMTDLLHEAADAGKPVRIHVEQTNPAMRLYRRLGFERIGEAGIYDLLEWNGATTDPR